MPALSILTVPSTWEAQARNAQVHDLVALARREFAPDPDEALVAVEPIFQPCPVEAGEDRKDGLGCLGHVDDAARFRIERGDMDIEGEFESVAIEQHRARREQGRARLRVHGVDVGRHAQGDQTHHHDAEHQNDDGERDPQARACDGFPRLARAIDGDVV
jgi:hypothetical protein